MPKQPVEVETPEEPLVEEAPAKGKGRATRARVTLEGDVPTSTLQRVIPGDSSFPDVPTKAGKMSFSKAIRNTEWRIFAERLSPRQMPDGTPLEDVLEVPSYDSITENDVKKEIQQARGGTRWIARVIDVEDNNRVIATKLYVIGGDPIQEPSSVKNDQSGGFQNRGGNGFPEDDGSESPEEAEARVASEIEADPQGREKKKQARIKELEIEAMRQDVERMKAEAEMRRIREENKPPDAKGDDSMRRAIDEATRPLRESNEQLRKELDAKRAADESERHLNSQLAPMKTAIDALIQKSNVPPQQGPSITELMGKLDTMKAEIKNDTTSQIAQALNNLSTKFEAQISNINTQLTAFMSRPQDGGALATAAVGALTQIAIKKDDGGGSRHSDPIETTRNVLGLVKDVQEVTGGGTKGEASMPPDFPSFLVDRVTNLAPQVIEYLERKQGGPVSREELTAMFKDYGIKMYQELDGTIKREMRAGLQKVSGQPRPALQPVPALSAPRPFNPAPPGAPGAKMQPGIPQAISPNAPPPSPEFPPPPSVPTVQFGGGQPAPQPVAAPAPVAPMTADASIEKETGDRVNWVLGLLVREMKMGVQEMQWPDKAYGNLPKDIIDRIVTASTDKDIYDAISPYADPAIMETIFGYVSESNPQHDFYREWLIAGVKWIKEEATGAGEEPEPESDAPPGMETR